MKIAMLILVAEIALQVGVPPRLAQELAMYESGLDPECVGITGDLGIMQLNPAYLSWFKGKFWHQGVPFNWKEPRHNIYVGLRYLKWIHDEYEFNWWTSLVAYNCGPDRVAAKYPPDESIEFANKIIARATVPYTRHPSGATFGGGYEQWGEILYED